MAIKELLEASQRKGLNEALCNNTKSTHHNNNENDSHTHK